MELLTVTAVIVTRGDVDIMPILKRLPVEWPRVVWDNLGTCEFYARGNERVHHLKVDVPDLSVYGRYAALEMVETPLVFTVDDDVFVSDPQAIVDAWKPGHVVCNMPQEFRHDGYTDSALVGFGACFERGLPKRAFMAYEAWPPGPRMTFAVPDGHPAHWQAAEHNLRGDSVFLRTADVVFTTLTPRILVDVPKTDREFASDPNRMWKTPGHYEERTRMLELARQVRDAT